jgi:quinoprotein glucose dehydrogenase
MGFAQKGPAPSSSSWPTYGGDPGGQRYSGSASINRSNVDKLKVAWTFHTHSLDGGHKGSFEATPILFQSALYFTSPFDQVFALDPVTGARKWSYDPSLNWNKNLGIVTSRGVAAWASSEPSPATCESRIFLGTLDGRLIALDAASGEVCQGFGNNGTVDLTQNVEYRKDDDYAITSPPTVIGDVVVVGAGIEDNLRVDVELGDVRGFDARTGKLLWTWEPIPWAKKQKLRTGAANTWGVIAADTEHHMLYLPVSSPSPDYYGGLRPGDDRDADSIVALDSDTGKKVWAFQVVHHDIWDYDIAAEPLLFTFHGNVPAVAVTTKMGMVFVFNRLTGQPLYNITERPVPQTDVPGEVTSKTQPFPDLPALSPLTLDTSRPLGLTPEDDAFCRKVISGMRYEGIYTPPSLKGTVLFPSNVGGVNWGSAALDPATGILYANTNRLPFFVRMDKQPLLPKGYAGKIARLALVLGAILCLLLFTRLGSRSRLAWSIVILLAFGAFGLKERDKIRNRLLNLRTVKIDPFYAPHFGTELGYNTGAPYSLFRQPLEHGQTFCAPTPFGALSALNLNTGKPAWETPLGTRIPGQKTGTWSVGGPIVTAGGLVFTAATPEPYLRAFDSTTGEEVWKGGLPVPAQATPMTYVIHGKQYIVVAAGGHPTFGTPVGDSVVAFALPDTPPDMP